MAKIMKRCAWISFVITMLCAVLYANTSNKVILTFMITFGTTAYHFIMRLIVGGVINHLLNNHVDYHAKWFQVNSAEKKFYEKLKMKKWKNKMPSYDPGSFDNRIHSWDEIAQAMCQAELVHEVIIILSFLPILAAIPFGAWAIFFITSVLSAAFDAMFVIMQRYNRSRIIRMLLR